MDSMNLLVKTLKKNIQKINTEIGMLDGVNILKKLNRIMKYRVMFKNLLGQHQLEHQFQ